MDTQTETGSALNGAGKNPPVLTRAQIRAAAKADTARPNPATPTPAATRTASQKKRKKRGTGEKALATAARKAAELGATARTGPGPVAIPIAAAKITGENPVMVELSTTFRGKKEGWTPERASVFLKASAMALDDDCQFQRGTTLRTLLKAA